MRYTPSASGGLLQASAMLHLPSLWSFHLSQLILQISIPTRPSLTLKPKRATLILEHGTLIPYPPKHSRISKCAPQPSQLKLHKNCYVHNGLLGNLDKNESKQWFSWIILSSHFETPIFGRMAPLSFKKQSRISKYKLNSHHNRN